MFTFPQPSNRNQNRKTPIPTVDISNPPEVLDTILRLIYPGVEPPKISDISILAALFSAADKYNVTSIYPVLRVSLKTFLPSDSFGVYFIACRFGFLEEAKEATRVSTSWSMIDREHEGLLRIEDFLEQYHVGRDANCNHWEDGINFYFCLAKEVGDVFVRNPCLELGDLFSVFHKIPDPPPGCKPQPNSAEWYYDGDDDSEEAFSCPLAPMTIRDHLMTIVRELKDLNHTLLNKAFERGIGNS